MITLRALPMDYQTLPLTAAYILPAFRGKSKPIGFPIARHLPAPSITRNAFVSAYSDLPAFWIGCCESMGALYDQLRALPKNTSVLGIENIGVFSCAETPARADALLEQFTGRDTVAPAEPALPYGVLHGRIAVITGAAQGFGKGIAQVLLDAGAYVVLSDINQTTLAATAHAFSERYGPDRVYTVIGDVSSDDGISRLCEQAVLHYGGIDVMLSNAGIVIAGDLENMTSEVMKKISDINYVGYFRCVKYASRFMKIQSAFDADYTADIIQINSVAGLIGYQKNFAYCGSKFGALGLTECFAKELLPYRIKVNAICPGNYYDGPLWSDPEKGLFIQYLKAGKIPGGKTVQDAIDYYMQKEPLHRGCTAEDIAQAVLYCLVQQFETGVYIPVTGGLAMGFV